VILPDVNVLLHAFRRDSSEHQTCQPWLDSVVAGDAQFGLSPLVLSAVLRISTNSRVFKEPSSLAEGFAFCQNLLDQPHSERIEPSERHWTIFEQLVRATDTRGPRLTDAWFAALAIEHACTWITYDHDYARFEGLAYRRP